MKTSATSHYNSLTENTHQYWHHNKQQTSSLLTCACQEMLEERLAHEAVVSAKMKAFSLLCKQLMDQWRTHNKVKLFGTEACLLFVSKCWGQAWCLADRIMRQRVSKGHLLLQQKQAI